MGFWGNIFRRIRKALLPVCRTIKTTFKYTLRKLSAAGKAIIDYAIENPWKFGISSILIVGGILVLVVPVAVGFGTGGVALGSSAAVWQASIGNVVANSLFAVLQSLTMTGVFYWIGSVMVVVGVAILAVARLWNWFFGGNDDSDKKDT
ncbi:hypothetical protein Q9L58_001462 [Maublancomyces gigas]|uniref:Uncharacterized protein n=1 Tax=Discina gigas TaxID=1032678 RepID=A0ABR3GU36_9PEZI